MLAPFRTNAPRVGTRGDHAKSPSGRTTGEHRHKCWYFVREQAISETGTLLPDRFAQILPPSRSLSQNPIQF